MLQFVEHTFIFVNERNEIVLLFLDLQSLSLSTFFYTDIVTQEMPFGEKAKMVLFKKSLPWGGF